MPGTKCLCFLGMFFFNVVVFLIGESYKSQKYVLFSAQSAFNEQYLYGIQFSSNTLLSLVSSDLKRIMQFLNAVLNVIENHSRVSFIQSGFCDQKFDFPFHGQTNLSLQSKRITYESE